MAAYASLQLFTPVMRSEFPPFNPNAAADIHGLGSEYFEIAKSIRLGRGFSSPFRVESGPTAWMPPLLPVILAAVHSVCYSSQVATAFVILFINAIVVAWVSRTYLLIAERYRVGWLALAALVTIFISNFQYLFQQSSDGWLNLLVFHLISCFLLRFHSLADRSSTVYWGMLGGLASLVNPAIVFGWMIVTFNICRGSNAKRNAAISLLIAFAIQSPWLVRNYIQFQSFIPIKSNALFELEQSVFRTSEEHLGLIGKSALSTHPYCDSSEAKRHAELGEVEYIRRRAGGSAWSIISAAPSRWMLGCVNRFCAIAFYAPPYQPSIDFLWWSYLVSFLYPVPFLLLLVRWVSPERLSRHDMQLLLFTAGYVVSYVLVSYYGRYGVALIGVKFYACILGLVTIRKLRLMSRL